ncbi:unnamed protein product [Cylicostephanus goldi]|uniref:Uncharacterized protein n=1 Tax=Cylicostephanus goldi TaxID=71465 RepID=A0A3P6TGR6_CYLGO|nr:unnamed protein product [Cylicostephanus goldi]
MSSSHGAPVVLAGGVGGMPVTALHQQPMQIYIDPASKQHYMAIESEFCSIVFRTSPFF